MPPERPRILPPPPSRDVLAANLIAARKASGHTQESLAFAADLHRTEISLLERQERLPRALTLLRIAHSAGISLDALVAGMRWMPTREEAGLLVRGYWKTEAE